MPKTNKHPRDSKLSKKYDAYAKKSIDEIDLARGVKSSGGVAKFAYDREEYQKKLKQRNSTSLQDFLNKQIIEDMQDTVSGRKKKLRKKN